jgi:hypothetical protein
LLVNPQQNYLRNLSFKSVGANRQFGRNENATNRIVSTL